MPTYSDGFQFAHAENFKKWMEPFIGQPVVGVEIGSWEGCSAGWLVENVLNHPQSRLHCVDNWEGEEGQQIAGLDNKRAEQLFLENTEIYRIAGRIKPWKGKSAEVLPTLFSLMRGQVSIVYVDGDHRAPAVLYDSVLCYELLKVGGRMIWDDMLWSPPGFTSQHKPEIAIRAVLECFAEKLKVIEIGYQVCVEKVG